MAYLYQGKKGFIRKASWNVQEAFLMGGLQPKLCEINP